MTELTDKNIEELKESYELLSEQLKGIDFLDFQNLMIAEKLQNVEEIRDWVNDQYEAKEHEKIDMDISYEELIESLNKIKESVSQNIKLSKEFEKSISE